MSGRAVVAVDSPRPYTVAVHWPQRGRQAWPRQRICACSYVAITQTLTDIRLERRVVLQRGTILNIIIIIAKGLAQHDTDKCPDRPPANILHLLLDLPGSI